MIVNSVPLSRYLHWLSVGWHYFCSNIGAWLAMSLLFFISMALLIIIPRAGVFILVLLLPILLAGILYAVDRIEHGNSITVEHIAYGFRAQQPRQNLLLLGSLMLLYLFGLIWILYPFSGALFQTLYAIHYTEQHTLTTLHQIALQFTHQNPLILWGQILTVISGLAAFSYAIPLVLFAHKKPLKAIILSLQAVLYNIIPISLLFILGFILLALATFAFGIGFLILLPVLAGANYASYREIFTLSPVSEDLAPVFAGAGKNKDNEPNGE